MAWRPEAATQGAVSSGASGRGPRLFVSIGCALALSLGCCGCLVWAVIQGQADRREFGALEAACRGAATPGTGAYPVPAPRAQAMRHQSDGSWARESVLIPSASESDTRADTNVVVCLEPEVVVQDEPCVFSDVMMRAHTFPRNHRVVHARLVVAATGAPLFESDLAAPVPACTLTSTGLVPSDGTVYDGDSIGRDQLGPWMQAALAPR